jgi:hypothetical protein
MQEQLPPLPHLVVDEPKRSPWAIAGIFFLSLMVLAIPLGIYLVSQRTQLTPQAADDKPIPETTAGIILESKLSPEARGGIIPVDVYVKSPGEAVNLVNAQINYDPNLLSIDKVATDAASIGQPVIFNKWLEARADNIKGSTSVIAAVPNPGVLSADQPDQKIYLATLHIRPKAEGTAVLEVTSQSQLLRNSDNSNLFQTGSDLVLNLSGAAGGPDPSSSPKPSPGENPPLLVLTNPVVATNYSYFKPIEIIWSSFNVERIVQINLLVNGEIFGPVAQNLDAKEGKTALAPQEILPLPYIQLSNTYQLEVTGVSKNGEVVKITSAPFGILGLDEVAGTPPDAATFAQNQLSINDASRMMSFYLVLPLADKSLDFNRDDVINELDFFLFKQNLFNRGIIR